MNHPESEHKMSLGTEELEHAPEAQEHQRVDVPEEANKRIENIVSYYQRYTC
jgi:hypothetical protein